NTWLLPEPSTLIAAVGKPFERKAMASADPKSVDTGGWSNGAIASVKSGSGLPKRALMAADADAFANTMTSGLLKCRQNTYRSPLTGSTVIAVPWFCVYDPLISALVHAVRPSSDDFSSAKASVATLTLLWNLPSLSRPLNTL